MGSLTHAESGPILIDQTSFEPITGVYVVTEFYDDLSENTWVEHTHEGRPYSLTMEQYAVVALNEISELLQLSDTEVAALTKALLDSGHLDLTGEVVS